MAFYLRFGYYNPALQSAIGNQKSKIETYSFSILKTKPPVDTAGFY